MSIFETTGPAALAYTGGSLDVIEHRDECLLVLPYRNGVWQPWQVRAQVGNVLSAPSLVQAPSGYRGLLVTDYVSGQVFEVYRLQGEAWGGFNHGRPDSTNLPDTPPSFVAAPSGYIGGLVTLGSGVVWELSNEGGWQWAPLGPPPNEVAVSAASLVAAPSGYIGALILGGNHQIYELYRTGMHAWNWVPWGRPPTTGGASTPSLIAAPSGYVGGLVLGLDGHIYELYYAGGANWEWTDHGLPPGTKAINAPSMVASPSGYIGGHVIGENGHLFALQRPKPPKKGGGGPQGPPIWTYKDYGPPPNTTAIGNPCSVVGASGPIRCFVRTAKGNCFEYSSGVWTDHGIPAFPPIGPSVFSFAASPKNVNLGNQITLSCTVAPGRPQGTVHVQGKSGNNFSVDVFSGTIPLSASNGPDKDTIFGGQLNTAPANDTQYMLFVINSNYTTIDTSPQIVTVTQNKKPPKGKVGLASYVVGNGLDDNDELSIWSFDQSSGLNTLIKTIPVGDSATVDFSEGDYFTITAISKNWVDSFNNQFGANEDPETEGTAQIGGFQRWTAVDIYGQKMGGVASWLVS